MHHLRLLACALFLLLGAGTAVHGQMRPLDYQVFSTGQGAVAGSTPFWHYASTRGQYRPGATADWVSGALLALPFHGTGGLDWSVGGEVVGRLSDRTNTLHLHQLYGKVQYRGFRLSVGRFPETIAGTQPDLSMGSLMVSQNAPPVPKVKLFTPDYLDVPFTDGHVQVRGRWSDGLLGVNRVVERPKLHQKTFYLKFNVAPFAVSGGVVQNTVWGGKGQSNEFIDYAHLLVGSQAGTEEDRNRVGNTIAAYDFGLQYTLDDWKIRATRLFYLEDTVSMRLRSPWDGMWALNLRRTDGSGWIDGLLYEHVNTIQQDALPGAPRGRADYYYHFIFRTGWTYKGTVLGNPVMRFSPERGRVDNNMIVAHHLGAKGTPISQLSYKIRLTYSRNYGICEDRVVSGTCDVVFSEPVPPDQNVRPRGEVREDQYSLFGEVRYRLSDVRGLQLVGSVAADVGEYYGRRWGLRFGLRWNGSVPLN